MNILHKSLSSSAILSLSFILFVFAPAYAQVTPAFEYRKKIDLSSSVSAEDQENAFGEHVNVYSGRTRFSLTDVDLPGNNALRVSLARYRDAEVNLIKYADSSDLKTYPTVAPNAFRDWELDIPMIRGVYNVNGLGGMTGNGAHCNATSAANALIPSAVPEDGGASTSSDYFSSGPWVHIDATTSMRLLYYISGDAPNVGLPVRWKTRNNWFIACLPATSNGQPGDGFLAISPNGDRYWFDHPATRPNPKLVVGVSMVWNEFGDPSAGYQLIESYVSRKQVDFLVSKIEDRHGNWVSYNYVPGTYGRLSSITSSDGRSIELQYDSEGRVVTAGFAGAAINYQYNAANKTLERVNFPDGTYSTYNFSSLFTANGQDGTKKCGVADSMSTSVRTVSMRSRTGTSGVFSFKEVLNGRTYAPKVCGDSINPANGRVIYTQDKYPILFVSTALVGRTLSGPGLASRSWTWQYPSPSYAYDIQCNSGCPTTKVIVETHPDGTSIQYTYGIRYNLNEGLLLKKVFRAPNNSIAKTDDFDYEFSATGKAYAAWSLAFPLGNIAASEKYPQPLKSVVQNLDGRNFSISYSDFDLFARPTKVIRASQ